MLKYYLNSSSGCKNGPPIHIAWCNGSPLHLALKGPTCCLNKISGLPTGWSLLATGDNYCCKKLTKKQVKVCCFIKFLEYDHELILLNKVLKEVPVPFFRAPTPLPNLIPILKSLFPLPSFPFLPPF